MITEAGQTVWNIAVQEYGTPEALFVLLEDNNIGFEDPANGTELQIRSAKDVEKNQYNQVVRNAFFTTASKPANAINEAGGGVDGSALLLISGTDYLRLTTGGALLLTTD